MNFKIVLISGQFGMVYKAHLVRSGGGQTELQGVSNQQTKLKFVAVKILKGNTIHFVN